MQGKDLIRLATDFTAGTVTADAIKDRYGEGVLTTVLAIAAGGAMGLAAHAALDVLDEHTGLVSGAGEVLDDVVDTFKFW